MLKEFREFNRVYSKKKRNLARAKKEKNGLRKNKAERKAV